MNQHDNKPGLPNQAPEHRKYTKKSFDERYQRLTIYVERELFKEIQYLREQGSITNLTQFFHNAIYNHLHS